MTTVDRRDIEGEMLIPFQEVLSVLRIEPDGLRGDRSNRFDPGFGLTDHRRFRYGDLRVNRPDRIVIVEVESGGGLTNLLKYSAHAEAFATPILLLHVFGTGTMDNYGSHVRLWDFTWERIRPLLWSDPTPRLFARKYQYTKLGLHGLGDATQALRRCLTDALPDVCRDIFGYVSPVMHAAQEAC